MKLKNAVPRIAYAWWGIRKFRWRVPIPSEVSVVSFQIVVLGAALFRYERKLVSSTILAQPAEQREI
jgi:hypothetical protein